MNSASEAKLQQELEQSPEVQKRLRRLMLRRVSSALFIIAALGLFLLWIPASSRYILIRSLIANRLLIGLLLLFGLVMMSLLWSRGQVMDVWLFRALNLRGYRAVWLDRLMWAATQVGNVGFIALVAVTSYLLGDRGFAIRFTLGSLTLLLLVTIIKAATDRVRPYKVLLDTRVVGWREIGLSFPSGHTTQAFFMATIFVSHFQLPLAVAVILYGVAVIVGITRVYLGVHYPRDVIAGAILGLIWGTAATVVAPYL